MVEKHAESLGWKKNSTGFNKIRKNEKMFKDADYKSCW